jgi:hypothetical protein
MHYKSIDLDRILDDPALPQSMFEPDRSAEVLIVYQNDGYDDQETDIVRTILHRKLPPMLLVSCKVLTSQSEVELRIQASNPGSKCCGEGCRLH